MKFGLFEITVPECLAIIRILREGWRRLQVPKVKKNKIGIVIAMDTESDKERMRLRHDLIKELRRYLNDSSLLGDFHVLEFPQRLCAKIGDQRTAAQYLMRSRGHFILYGVLFQRTSGGRPNYLFRLHGVVMHRPVKREVSHRLSNEFRELLPSKVEFPEAEEVLGFELTRECVGYVVKYVIAIAALISTDFGLSHKILTSLRNELDGLTTDAVEVESLQHKIKVALPEAAFRLLTLHYDAYTVTRNKNHVLNAKPLLDELSACEFESYSAHLMQSIYHFFTNDLEAAKADLHGIKSKDSTWRYNLGFLYAFEGDVTAAWEQYRRAFDGLTAKNVVNDTEMFISDVIDEYPERPHLLFFRGLINHKVKHDYKLAQQDFEEFLRRVSDDKFNVQIELAKKYLSEIGRHFGI